MNSKNKIQPAPVPPCAVLPYPTVAELEQLGGLLGPRGCILADPRLGRIYVGTLDESGAFRPLVEN